MLQVYWACLLLGVMFAVVTILFGDLLGNAFHGALDSLSFDHLQFLQPMVLIAAITIFGGAGVLLSKYSSFALVVVALLSLLFAMLLSMLLFFAYVKPMKNSENSIGFSMAELIGRTGEVIVPIPSKGCGEILIKIGAGYTNQIAARAQDQNCQGRRSLYPAGVSKFRFPFPFVP